MLRAAAKAKDKQTYTALMASAQRELLGGRYSLVRTAARSHGSCCTVDTGPE